MQEECAHIKVMVGYLPVPVMNSAELLQQQIVCKAGRQDPQTLLEECIEL
ncbi:hypothetical protein [Pseudoalteromonas ardens]|nr:hypothetical protein [Pseudoalteromonas sp. R96]MDK1310665.1 hypothetical protein [Pseudoalteromonas sp. R96]